MSALRRSKTVLQLGAGRLMTRSIQLLQDDGWTVAVIDRDPLAPGFAIADSAEVIELGDAEAVTEHAGQIGADVILAMNEAGVPSAAQASQRLGLAGLDPGAAWRCVDKGLMRDAWEEAGLRQPRFRVVGPEKVAAVAQELGYPVVLKPARGWGSRGVSILRRESDLPSALAFAQSGAPTDRFIVEEWIAGTEMTIEGLVQDGRVQVLARSDKIHLNHSRYRVASALNYPAFFSKDVLEEADELIGEAVRALGIRDGAFHCECIVAASDVTLVEMAGRPGGGAIFSRIVEAVSGICMPKALVAILNGEAIDVSPRHQRGACYRFFAPPSGVFRSVHGLEDARRSPGVLDLDFHLAAGATLGVIECDMARPGAIVTQGADREEAIANAEQAIATLRFDVDPCGY